LDKRVLTVQIAVSDEFLGDLLTTAVEGGINYWAGVESLDRDDDLRVTWIRLRDLVDDRPCGVVTRSHMFDGLQRFCDAYRGDVPAKLDDGDFDAEDCDVMLQLGVFGEVVYG
jgi:hypothetical protein